MRGINEGRKTGSKIEVFEVLTNVIIDTPSGRVHRADRSDLGLYLSKCGYTIYSATLNPEGRLTCLVCISKEPIRATVERVGDGHNVVVNGRVMVSRESFAIADRIAEEINSGAPNIRTECGDVAASILASEGAAQAAKESAKFRKCARCGADKADHPIYGVCGEWVDKCCDWKMDAGDLVIHSVACSLRRLT